MSLPYNYVSSIASSQTKEFFRPKTVFERIQLILSVTWFCIAFLASTELQAYLFFAIIVTTLVNYCYLIISGKPHSSFLNTTFKFGIFFFLYIFIRNPSKTPLDFYSLAIDDIVLVQKTVLSVLIAIGLVMSYTRLELLKPSSKKKILENYFDFIFQVLKGIGYAIFLYVFFDLINWVPAIVSNLEAAFPNVQDVLLIIGSIALVVASQGPEGKDLKNLFARDLFLISETRFERARDSILKVSIFLLFLLKVLPIFTTTHETLVTEQYWTDGATLLFVLGIITFVLSLFENKGSSKNNLTQLNEKLNDYLPNNFKDFKQSFEDLAIEPDKQQYFKLTEDFPLINKENTKFIAKKNSVAIPIKETPEGTSVIFVGENDVENISPNGKTSKELLEETATAIMIPNDVWNKANLTLEAIKPTDETIRALALKGIDSKEKLLALAQSSLSDFKNIANSQIVKQKFQGVIDNFQQGKYFVSDTAKGTMVRLPGITVIDNPETTFVRVFGIKVLESHGYTFVNLPFVKVVESPDYQLVKLPGLNVLEAGKSNLVNIAGFQILDGDRKEIENAQLKINAEAGLFDTAVDRIDNHLNAVIDNPDSFLLAKNASGKKIELLTAKNSEQAVISNNLLPEKISKGKFEFEVGSSKTKTKKKVKPDKKINLKSKEVFDFPSEVSIEDQGSYEDKINSSPELKKIDKLYNIVKMSHESIDLERLAKFLEFDSVSELENWLVEKNIPGLQIDWSESILMINDETLRGIRKILNKSK